MEEVVIPHAHSWPAPRAAHLGLDLELISRCPPSPGGPTAQERCSVDIADEGVIFRSKFRFLAEIIKNFLLSSMFIICLSLQFFLYNEMIYFKITCGFLWLLLIAPFIFEGL